MLLHQIRKKTNKKQTLYRQAFLKTCKQVLLSKMGLIFLKCLPEQEWKNGYEYALHCRWKRDKSMETTGFHVKAAVLRGLFQQTLPSPPFFYYTVAVLNLTKLFSGKKKIWRTFELLEIRSSPCSCNQGQLLGPTWFFSQTAAAHGLHF